MLVLTAQTVPVVFIQFLSLREDPFSFILDDFFGDNAIHLNGGILVQVPILLIPAILLLGYAEVLRLWMLVIATVVIVITNTTSTLNLLKSDTLSCEGLLRHYKECYLQYVLSADVLTKVASLGITACFWICVMEIVSVIKAD